MGYNPTPKDLSQWDSEIPSESMNSPHQAQINSPQTQNQSGAWYSPQNLLSNYGKFATNVALGAGDALRNTLASGANILPGMNIPMAQSGQGGAYKIGNMAGNLGAFMGGGELLDAARAGTEIAPLIGQSAQWLGGQQFLPTALRQALGGAAYGGLATEQNRGQNAALGAGTSAAFSVLPPVAGAAVKGMQYLNPQKYVNNIVDNMSGGQSMSDTTKSVLSSIKNAYDNQRSQAGDLYSSVRANLPTSNIYENVTKPNPLMSMDAFPGYTGYYRPQSTKFDVNTGTSGQYPNLPSSTFDNYTSGLTDLHNKFMDNPNFDNAHKLQSELGSVSSQLRSGNTARTISTINANNALDSARGALKSDINNFLSRQDPALVDKYNQASQNFQQNVSPYRNDPALYKIATGETTNVTPSSLANIFKAPDSDMQTVLSHLPTNTMDKVLYTQLGKDTPSKNPFSFLRAYGRLNEQGLGDYISPQLQQQVDSLQNRIKMRSTAQSLLVGGLAAHAGAAHGMGTAAAMGIGGGALASPFMNFLGRRLPIDQMGAGLSSVGKSAYPLASKGILANYLNQNGGQNNGS